MSTTCCSRCNGSGDGSMVLLGESADSSPVCSMCVGTGRVPLALVATVKLADLTEAQLRKLLDWDPDLSSTDSACQILLAAARNRRMPEDVPVSMVAVTA